MRPDGFVLGQDPEAGKEELATIETTGCARCHRGWPQTTFRKVSAAVVDGTKPEVICDSCQDKEATAELAAQIDEAQGIATALGPTRYVEVEGIESKSNVIKFRYATHLGGEELKVTTLTVWFKGKQTAEPTPNPCYRYLQVPTAICEAWFAAPAHGQSYGIYFAEQIRNSYPTEKKS